MDRAYDMLRAMEREGLRPNTYTYTSLIDGWARQGDLPQAMEAVRDLPKRLCSLLLPPLH